MIETSTFQPQWASAPGETIADILVQRKISVDELSISIGRSLKFTQQLICGAVTIDVAVAKELEKHLGPSATFWMNREERYQEAKARLVQPSSVTVDKEWLRLFPISDMIKFGWIEPARTAAEKMTACLKFFNVREVTEWNGTYGQTVAVAAFRTSLTFEPNPNAVAAWLRQAEIKATQIVCAPWNAQEFERRLPEMRQLTSQKDPNVFWPKLQKLCASCGVALVAVRAPKGCRASGATRFLSDNKALIVLSFRYRSDDQFWFTFFHEAGHLLLHGRDAVFLEDDSDVTRQEEIEANSFAEDILIPRERRTELLTLKAQKWPISRFAKSIGISPGIVVGQLQHLERIPRSMMNSLKRRYDWSKMNF